MNQIEIDRVIVRDRKRQAGNLDSLKDSIREIGLMQPITVTADLVLIAGFHRLTACKELGWDTIPAIIVELDGLQAELAEIDENLIRNELNQFERATWQARRKEIYEILHPGSKHGANSGGNQHTKDKVLSRKVCDSAEKETPPSYVESASKAQGKSKRLVELEAQRGKALQSIANLIKGTRFENSGTDLDELVKLLDPKKGGSTAIASEALERAMQKGISVKIARLQIVLEKRQLAELRQAEEEQKRMPTVHLMDCREYLNDIADSSIDLILTDPPYLTEFQNADFDGFISSWLGILLAKLKPEGRAYICTGAYPDEMLAYLTAFKQTGFIVDAPLVWTYRNTLGQTPRTRYNLNYQLIWHLYRDSSRELDTSVTNEMFSVQDINAPDGRQGNRYHTWQKPDELANRLIRHASRPGDTVLDIFACTGTFLLAASRLGRVGIGCELDQDNIEIAKQRGCKIG
ncbi:MAG: hypothetical protein EBR82_59680 [Caulobacteraceae bacterium]|nr:hypothetical protein [Caulobacteraceae bacterium]